MTKRQIGRLKKLSEHLKNGKLGHENFNFGIYNSAENNSCGTNGCAIGECPVVFPRSWKWNIVGSPTLKNHDRKESFFGISYIEYAHLFIPDHQSPTQYGGKHLDENASKEDVASNIDAFIDNQN